MIELKILNATYHKFKFNQEQAITTLIEAMEIASDENLISYFVFSIHQIDDILKPALQKIATSKTFFVKKAYQIRL